MSSIGLTGSTRGMRVRKVNTVFQTSVVPLYQCPRLHCLRLHVRVHTDSGPGLAVRGRHHQDELRADGLRHRGVRRVRSGLRRHPFSDGRGGDACGREVHRCRTLHDCRNVFHLPALQAQADTDGMSSNPRAVRHVFM